MNSDAIKVVDSIDEIYPIPGSAARVESLLREFKNMYSTEAIFVSRAPGRVNLIGEHIDYSDYSVLPMALADKDILIAVWYGKSTNSNETCSRIHLANIDSSKFPTREIKLDSTEDYCYIDASKHEWSHYFMAGLKGILKHKNIAEPLLDMFLLVDGNVPPGAGVSSSSAFVCCSALATMRAYEISMSKTELTNVAISSERLIGVQIGGMDQTASICGKENCALLIHFYPSLMVEKVPLPSSEDVVFVIAHTLVTADKHVTAPIHYNLRVMETRLASLVLSHKYLKKQIRILRRFQEDYVVTKGLFGECSGEEMIIKCLQEMLSLSEETFSNKDGYTLEQVAGLLDMSGDQLKASYMSDLVIKADTFQLYKRVKHVFSEALRVYLFRKISVASEPDAYKKLGQLMNESQQSCDKLFDCSCKELNELTSIALKNGAYGSRLTGAGWGGCSISLVPRTKMESFEKALKEEYYDKYSKKPLIFANIPGDGALIYQV